MGAWAKATGGEEKITYLADGNCDFIKALGLAFDASAGGMGERSLDAFLGQLRISLLRMEKRGQDLSLR